ncbi:winged helix-turn-helix domain-containing protein [Micromonospora globbae]|uniref:winged helix-turn-helix domain-containing protein n=1 Tax=Micromonospora globbae TaxID=1894969 RepID=UPI00386E9DA3|nr:winged helix-turn-helix domain-containing protein [Micromonospora globbae]
MRGIPVASMVIGIASSPAARRQLAQLLGGTEAFLIVSSVEQAREILGVVPSPAAVATTTEPAAHAVTVGAARAVTGSAEHTVTIGAERAATAGAARALTGSAERAATAGGRAGAAPADPPALIVDSDRRVVRWLDREIRLTRLEHDLLLCLVGAPGRVWTYERLHLKVWGNKHLGRGSDIHSVVRRVRRKLATLDASATIDAVRGVGFRLASV